MSTFPDTVFPPTQTPEETHELQLQFTGTGSEYFRIWIVNTLLIVITVGLYYPWAKARKLRFLWGHTMVGAEPLAFHGNPTKMFKGYMLVGIFFALYSWAGRLSLLAALIAIGALIALSPALLQSSMQFRLGNTSWRGLRMRFTGSSAGMYQAALPIAVCAVSAFFLPEIVSQFLDASVLKDTWLVLPVLALLSLPWGFARLKRYQHSHYAIGTQESVFRASTWDFVKLVAIPALVILALYGVGISGVFYLVMTGGDFKNGGLAALTFPFMILALGVIVIPYIKSRLQNLIWSQTASQNLQFHSKLKARSLMWLTFKNWFLIVVTLGFYWPFALVAGTKLRLQAVSITSSIDPDQLFATVPAGHDEATGDAAGDFFGIDIGL